MGVDWQYIVVLLVVTGCVIYAAYRIWRNFRSQSAASACANCPIVSNPNKPLGTNSTNCCCHATKVSKRSCCGKINSKMIPKRFGL